MFIINQWILSLIENNPNTTLFSSDFILEDGMNLHEYIEYEQSQFASLSAIYDLNHDFTIHILDSYHVQNKEIVYFYIINQYKKIVCKMSLTINKETGLLTGNNSYLQAVPKFTIENNYITQIGIAIKPKYVLRKVFCNDYDLISFQQGDNYHHDFFYTAKFECDQTVQNTLLFFTFVMENHENGQILIERKPVFFDQFDEQLKPFLIIDNKLILLDEKYPVHLSVWSSFNHNTNYEYPRKCSILLNNLSSFTVTDSLDNDWIVKYLPLKK